jgi:hypothetical protein
MKRVLLVTFAFGPAVFAQSQAPKASEPAPHPSFALEDPTILQGRQATKPQLGKAGPAPRLADGKPDLTGPWEPNAIAANVNMKATGQEIPFSAEGEALYKTRLSRLGKDDPEARCLPPGVPRLTTTPYPFRFVQTSNYIAILYDMEIVSTVDDPVMYTKPWSFTTYPKRLKGELLEYICNENEKDVQHFSGK